MLLAAALATVTLASCGEEDRGSPGAEQWRRLPDPPLSPRDHAVVIGVDGRMLVVGGWDFLCPPDEDCSTPEEPLHADGAVYDPGTDAWTEIRPAPFGVRRQEYAVAELRRVGVPPHRVRERTPARRAHPAAVLRPGRGPLDRPWTRARTHEGPSPRRPRPCAARACRQRRVRRGARPGVRPTDKTWTELPDDPLPRSFDRFVVPVGDRLVLTASSGSTDTTAARFDLASGDWTRLEDAPGRGYQLFGTDDGPLLNGHFIDEPGWLLDPTTWAWSELDGGGVDAAHVGGVLDAEDATYDIPNSVGQLASRTQLLVWDSGTESYVTIPPPAGREDVYDDSSTALGRDLFVFGGQHDGRLSGEAWLWTAATAAAPASRRDGRS
ncbi:hypothetical protein JCM10369A_29010 [Nocardioides pyridinolyticus]